MEGVALGNKVTRRRFLRAVSVGAAWITLTNLPGCKPVKRATKTMSSTTTSSPQPEHVQAYDSPLASPQAAWTFRSRPDLSPPAVDVAQQAHDTAPGYIFAAPKKAGAGQGGTLIVDDRGQVVWFRHPKRKYAFAMNFKVQHYRGEPVLTWWEGTYGSRVLDEYVILNSSYKEITRIHPGNGYKGGTITSFSLARRIPR